ncbi:hypothetical protein R3P38DRAFT_94825 [Favolaschia claudopus]|uniref:Uncharacterized protein n=1 Tax=Favolaschia claudopus TaxID=2862362 RepID=A0AAW0DA75_9AGAR
MYAECCRGVLGLVWRGVEARVGVGVGACGVYEDAHAENGGPSPAFEYAPPPTTTPTKREHLTPPLLSADRNGNGIAYSVYEATHAESGEPSPAFDYTPPLTTTPTKREESTPPLLSPPSADVKGDGFACGVYEDTHAESGEASSAFESTTPTTITIKREESTPPLPSPPSADIEQNEIPTKEEEEEVAEHTEDARDDTHTHHSASSPVRASPAPSRDFESESQHPNYHYYEQLEQRHLSRNEKARVRMARKRAQRKLLPLEAQAAIVEREREYQKKYRTKNRAVLRQLEKQRRLDLYRAKYGDEAFEVYVRERAERGARRLEQKKSLENRQARDEGDEEDEVEEDELDTSDDDGGGGNPSLTLRGAGPHWHHNPRKKTSDKIQKQTSNQKNPFTYF